MADDDKFLKGFLAEASERLKDLNEKVMALESRFSDVEALHAIFRNVHTLKGDSNFFGFTVLKSLAHQIEDLLTIAQKNQNVVNKAFMDLLWEGVRFLGKEVELIKANMPSVELTPEETAFLARLNDLAKASMQGVSTADAPSYRETDQVRYFCGPDDVSRPVFILQAYLLRAKQGTADNEMLQKFIQNVEFMREECDYQKKREAAETASKILADYEMLIDDSGKPNEFLLTLMEEGVQKILQGLEKTQVTQPCEAAPEFDFEPPKPSFRIEEERINEILDSLHQMEDIKKAFGLVRNKMVLHKMPNELVMEFQKTLNTLSYLSRDLLKMLIKIKVDSPRLLLEKVEKIIMALARSSDKKVRIHTEGENVFVEKSKIEALEEILPHVVRNCIDHGIETPEERRNAGKVEEGSIDVKVSESGGRVMITVSDDGRGINYTELRDDAFKKGKISADELKSLPEADSGQLLFLPGVTTSKSVSETSGRGVGLDIVLQRVKKMGGTIKVMSLTGKGTIFSIELPANGNPL